MSDAERTDHKPGGGDPRLDRLLAQERDRSLQDADLASLQHAVEQAVSEDRGLHARIRSRSTRTRWLAAGLALLLPVVVLLATPRPDLAAYPLGRLVLDLALWLTGLVLAISVVLRPFWRPEPSRGILAAIAFGAIALTLLVTLLPAADVHHQASLQGTGSDFFSRALACLGFGTAVAAPAVLWFWLLHRNPERQAAWPVFVAIAGACVGGLALALHCPIISPLHLVTGHFGVVLGLSVLGLGTAMR